MLDSAVLDFAEQCLSSPNTNYVRDDFSRAVAAFGFDYFILSGVPGIGQKLPPLVAMNAWPEKWYARYTEENYAAIDPVCIFLRRNKRQPFFWRDAVSLVGSEGDARVLDESSQFDLRSGFVIPIFDDVHWMSVLSLGSSERRLMLSPRDQAKLVTIASFGSAALTARATPPGNIDLSDREAEVLLWSASGKSAWEIGRLLSISENTVQRHQANARAKLGVSTTIQAVIDAVRQKLIFP